MPISSCTVGRAGRYISVASGAIAVINPKNTVSQSCVPLDIAIYYRNLL
jgi:hypothetical protein